MWSVGLLLLLLTTQTAATPMVLLTRAETAAPMKSVSVDRAGVWGVGGDGAAYLLKGTPGSPLRSPGRDWVKVQDGVDSDVPFTQLDAGTNLLWAVKTNQRIYYRRNITVVNDVGADFGRLADGSLVQVSVSAGGFVWGVNQQGSVYTRKGATHCSPLGDDWTRVGSDVDGLVVRQVSAGYAGVWAVTRDNSVYVRNDTFGDTGLTGSNWVKVDGQALSHLMSGDGFVLGLNANSSDGSLYLRCAVNRNHPTGLTWLKVKAKNARGEDQVLKKPVDQTSKKTKGQKNNGNDKGKDKGKRKGEVKVEVKKGTNSVRVKSLDTYCEDVWAVDVDDLVYHGHLGDALSHCQNL